MSTIETRRVVVTGMGTVSAAGVGFDKLWDTLMEGACCIGPIERFDPGMVNVFVDAELKDFDATEHGLSKKEARRYDRFTQYALIAADEAVAMAGLDFEAEADLTRIGTCVGSGMGGLKSFQDSHLKMVEKKSQKGLNPLLATIMEPNMAVGNVALRYGLKGPCTCVTTACASGSHSIGEAFRAIRYGYADAMLAGGAEAVITDMGMGAFAVLNALSKSEDPHAASLPFSAERNGFVLGEGAGILVLESLEHAQARGAKILAELVGFGSSCDAHHITAPEESGEGPMRAMRQALEEGGFAPSQLDYLNAHGTGTHLNDEAEAKALHLLCGDHAMDVLVHSVKGNIGHSVGAAGAIEAAVTVKCLVEQQVPGTLGCHNPDPELDVWATDQVVTDHPIRVALSNSLGFGGHNASLAFAVFTNEE